MTKMFFQPLANTLTIGIGLSIFAAQAGAHAQEGYRYHYVSLNTVSLPRGVSEFIPFALDDRARVYGSAYHADGTPERVATYADGVLTEGPAGYVSTSSARGVLGGSVAATPGQRQAALFQGRRTTLIPRRADETNTRVVSVNDDGRALVLSEGPQVSDDIFRIYDRGKAVWEYPLPSGGNCNCFDLNGQGAVSGAIVYPDIALYRAIRFQPLSDRPVALEPQAPYTQTLSFGISERGDVGVQSVSNADHQFEYGVWDRRGTYKAYYKGNVEYQALFSSEGLIVLTGSWGADLDSYIVPRPGKRLNLEALLDNPGEVTSSLRNIYAVNSHGDMVGHGQCGDVGCPTFLLKRIREGCD